MIVLMQFGDVWGFDPSPFVLKVQAYLKLVGLEFEMRRAIPLFAPKRKLPVIEDRGRVIADSSFILDYLKGQYGDPLDGTLTPEHRALSRSIQRMLEDGFYSVLVHERWIDPVGWKAMSRNFRQLFPLGTGWIVLPLLRLRQRVILYLQGIGRHSPDEILEIGARDLEALSVLLGNKPFLLGDRATSVDAVAFGFLASVLLAPINGRLKQMALTYANLHSYTMRLADLVFGPALNTAIRTSD